jgi:hypothetical protein
MRTDGARLCCIDQLRLNADHTEDKEEVVSDARNNLYRNFCGVSFPLIHVGEIAGAEKVQLPLKIKTKRQTGVYLCQKLQQPLSL